MNLGSTIKSFRKERGILKKDLANSIGISVTALAAIENNTSMPRKSTMEAIAGQLNTNISMIFLCCLEEKDIEESKRGIFKKMLPFLKEWLT